MPELSNASCATVHFYAIFSIPDMILYFSLTVERAYKQGNSDTILYYVKVGDRKTYSHLPSSDRSLCRIDDCAGETGKLRIDKKFPVRRTKHG